MAKNQRWSRTIGPPIDGATYHASSSRVPPSRPPVMPRSISPWPTLFASQLEWVKSKWKPPLKTLLPSFGIMFSRTAPVSTSAELPE